MQRVYVFLICHSFFYSSPFVSLSISLWQSLSISSFYVSHSLRVARVFCVHDAVEIPQRKRARNIIGKKQSFRLHERDREVNQSNTQPNSDLYIDCNFQFDLHHTTSSFVSLSYLFLFSSLEMKQQQIVQSQEETTIRNTRNLSYFSQYCYANHVQIV